MTVCNTDAVIIEDKHIKLGLLNFLGACCSAVGWGTVLKSWKVVGSIPDGVIGIFHWHNPSGRTVALGSTQPLTEISTRNISWGWRRPVRKADNLTTFMCRLSWNLGTSTSWNPQGLCRPVMGLLYLLPFYSTFYMVGETSETFCLYAGNGKFGTKNKERMSICIILIIFLYIMYSKK